jgi:HAD superfamily hydrolase (TIGR01457 family)
LSHPLALRYDAILFDLDGVLYRGDQAVPAARGVIHRIRGLGRSVLFLTNNSARTPQQVADRLHRLGVDADPAEILTSALATAAMLRREGGAGRTAFVIGERGIREALERIGVGVLDGEPESADLVVVGWDRSLDYAKLKTASLLVERGSRLVATNPDASFPAPDGLWPGAGAILAAVTTTTGATPTIVGKPARPMFEAAAELTGATHPLVVGDRLDTDIAGANGMEWDSLLVFSGTSKPADLPESPVQPTFVAEDVSGLLEDRSPARFLRAKPGDQAAIAALLEEVGLRSEGLQDRIDGTILTGHSPDGREIDATACLVMLGDCGLLRSVAVRKPLQGKGLGMLAASAALKGARAEGITQVSLFTETARAFFERLGFQKVDRSQLPEPIRTSPHATEECAETATAMVLELSGRSVAAAPQ